MVSEKFLLITFTKTVITRVAQVWRPIRQPWKAQRRWRRKPILEISLQWTGGLPKYDGGEGDEGWSLAETFWFFDESPISDLKLVLFLVASYFGQKCGCEMGLNASTINTSPIWYNCTMFFDLFIE